MVDFSKLEQASEWPFRIGGVMIHCSWYNMDDEHIKNSAIHVIELLPDNKLRCTSGQSTYEYTYNVHSFDPISDWYYLNSKVERQKKGFGLFISKIEKRTIE